LCTASETADISVFDFPWPIPKYQERLLLKNAPWNEINARIASTLAVSMASWSEPWSVPSIAHLIMESVKFSEAKTRSMVDPKISGTASTEECAMERD
jgi:hypothetical protein